MKKIDFKVYNQKIKAILKNRGFKKIPSFIELLEKGIEKELIPNYKKNKKPIPIEDLPVDLSLRPLGTVRSVYERIFPVSHVFELSYKYDRDFLDNFMPISLDDYLGRGSYKFVYKLPWNQVVKVGIKKFPSDPLFGSLYKEVNRNLEIYLKPEELQLKQFLEKKMLRKTSREVMDFKFKRLALERLHYWKIKNLLPDLVWPTRYFMGMRFRNAPFRLPMMTITPCDNQNLIPGKHLKEFVKLKEKIKQNPLNDKFFPKWKLNFDTHKFGMIHKNKLKKIAYNFHRVVEASKYLASKEKLIIDLHSENIIITIPEFELKIFDFHVFDEHLYEPSESGLPPGEDHIQAINEFIDSFELSKYSDDSSG